MDAADKLLAAIEAVQVEVRETRDEARARDEKIGQRLDEHDARFQRVEADTAVLRGNVVELQEWRNESAKQMSSQAQAMTSMAQAITNATNVALDAKASASTSVDEARKIVESAIKIHGVSMAGMVEASVTKSVRPLADKVDLIEKNDAEQNKTLATMQATLEGIAGSIGKAISNRWIRVAIVVGVLIGGVIAGYFGGRGTSGAVHELLP